MEGRATDMPSPARRSGSAQAAEESKCLEAKLSHDVGADDKKHDIAAEAPESESDVAAAVHQLSTGFEATEEERRAVLRKIDWMLMPLLCSTYAMTYWDKTSLNYAKLFGFQKELHISNGQYNWLGSLFFIGYGASSPLHSVLWQKLPLGRYLSICMLLWGATLMLHAAAFNFASMAVCRLFLGILEAAITPGYILLTGRFYRRDEQVSRTALWFSMNACSQFASGIAVFGILSQSPGRLSKTTEFWILIGGITIILGLVSLVILPSSPDTWTLLTPRERLVAVDRVRSNNAGLRSRKIKRYQIREALLGDPRLHLLTLIICCNSIANGGISNFSSTIIASLGFDKKQTALLGMAAGFSEAVGVVITVALFKLTKSRGVPAIFVMVVAVVGSAMMVGLPQAKSHARFGGYCLAMWYHIAGLIMYSLLSSSSVAGETKKMTFNLWFSFGYSIGNLIGPQIYRPSDAPAYNKAKTATLAMFVAVSILFAMLFGYHIYENKRRDRLYPNAAEDEKGVEFELSDLTDHERKSFRYPR